MLGKIFREKIKGLNKILAMPFIALKINPNVLSFLGIPLALISFYLMLQKAWLIAFVFAFFSVIIDLIDGTVARALKKESNFGNYFETMIDKYIELILFAGFAIYFPLTTALALGFSLIESYAKPRVALVIITDNRDWPAIAEHSERMLLLLIAIILMQFNLIFFSLNASEIILWLIVFLTIIGGIQRINYAKKLIKEAEEKDLLLPYIKEKKER